MNNQPKCTKCEGNGNLSTGKYRSRLCENCNGLGYSIYQLEIANKDLFALTARVKELEEALKQIAKNRCGVESTDTDEEQRKYWADLALLYRGIARAALAKGTT